MSQSATAAGHNQTQASSTTNTAVPPDGLAAPVAEKQLSELKGATKAAVFLLSLDEQTRSSILRLMTEDEVETLSREVARLRAVPAPEVDNVINEFEAMAAARSYVLEGGVEHAKRMLTEAFGKNGLALVERIMESLGTNAANLELLQKTDPRQLSKLIYNEHPQIIALILSHLAPAQGAALLNELPAEIRPEVARRMAQIDQFSPEIVDQIATFIGRRLKTLGEYSRKSYGGVRAVAEMMNRLDTQTSEHLLSTIARDNEPLSDTVRQLMFVFEDILKLEMQDIKALMSKVDRKVLVLSLKGSTDEMRKHFTQCLSQRAAEMFMEEVNSQGPVKIRDLESARGEVIAVVRKLQTDGTIGSQSAGDKYVN